LPGRICRTPARGHALPAEEMRALLKEFQEFVRQSVENDSAEKVARAVRSELL